MQYVPAVAISALRAYTRLGGLLYITGYEFAWEILQSEPSAAPRAYSSMWTVKQMRKAYSMALESGLPGMLGVHTEAMGVFADHPIVWTGLVNSIHVFGEENGGSEGDCTSEPGFLGRAQWGL